MIFPNFFSMEIVIFEEKNPAAIWKGVIQPFNDEIVNWKFPPHFAE